MKGVYGRESVGIINIIRSVGDAQDFQRAGETAKCKVDTEDRGGAREVRKRPSGDGERPAEKGMVRE